MSSRISKRGRGGPGTGKTGPGTSGRKERRVSNSRTEASGSGKEYVSQLNYLQDVKPTPIHGSDYLQSPSSTLPPPGKLLLPPLPKSRGAYSSSSRNEKNRTSHACDKCRKAKAKCSGGQPCDKCRNEGKDCMYGDGKRDKEKKDMERVYIQNQRIVQRNEQLEHAIAKFAPELSKAKRKELEDMIMSPASVTDDDDDLMTNIGSDARRSDTRDSSILGEENADADVGSPGSMDVIHEDTNRDENARAAGFMGKSSAVTWVQRAKRAAVHDLDDESPFGRSTSSKGLFADSTYHAEPADILTIQADEVNPLEWPPADLAKALVDSYFKQVQSSFPILSERDFYSRFNSFPKDQVSADDQCWLSVANMVFAIGARFAHVTHAEFRGDDRDHFIYYARARALGMDERTLNQDPELMHTTCLGVLGLYLLATDQLNRSWTVCSIAIRHSIALGLHVRSEAKDLSDMDKELRVRIFWSLYSLERFLDELTGRPSCLSDHDIGTPFPINLDENSFSRERPFYGKHPNVQSPGVLPPIVKAKFSAEQLPTPETPSAASKVPSMSSFSPIGSPEALKMTTSTTRLPITTSTYFIYRTRLSIISHQILTQLYCASLVKAKWSDVQDSIREIDKLLLHWKSSLPDEFDISSVNLDQNESFACHRAGLSMFYNSSRMTLFRPCLCRFEGRIDNESYRSKKFDITAAITCVMSARNVIACLPAISEPAKVYKITAWWHIVHYIIEAASVLMLELAYRAEHMPSQSEEILADSRKAVMWLRALSDQSIAARKGWEIFDNLLKIVAPKIGSDVKDMPRSAPVPPGWKWNRFGTSSGQGSVQVSVNDVSQEQQLPTYPNGMAAWITQSTYDLQQGFSVPAPTHMSAYATESGVTPSFLTGLYPFNEMYGRYEDFGPLQDAYFTSATYPGMTVGASAGMDILPVMGPVPFDNGMGVLGEGATDTMGMGVENDYEMEEYPGWNG